MQYVRATEYYSALEKKEIQTYATTWMNLQNIMLSEVKQTHKSKYCMILLIWSIQSTQIHRDRKQNGGYQRLGEGGNGEFLFNGYRVSVWEDEKLLETDGVDGCTTL